MTKLVAMKAMKAIKQRAKEPEAAPAPVQQWAEWEWPPLEQMRPYDVAHLVYECMEHLDKYTENGTLDKGYSFFFYNMSFWLDGILEGGTLGYSNGDPPYRPEDDCAEDDPAS